MPSAMPSAGLSSDVSTFLEVVDEQLGSLSGQSHTIETTREASHLVSAIFDADGRFTDAELRAWLDAVGGRLEPPVLVTPQRLRTGGMLDGASTWLDRPSPLFQLLVDADTRDDGRRSHRYYEAAMQLAHAAAAVDRVASPQEITAIDRFRATLLQAMDAASVVRPGAHRLIAADGGAHGPGPTPDAAAGAVTTPPAPDEPPVPIEDLLDELDALIGLDRVKTEVRRLTSMLRIQQLRAERDLPTVEVSHHLVFTGNPGTGKTTVARLLARIFRSLGLVSSGHLVETDRSQLVAGYVGQTATRTRAVLETGIGGTVLIDEAYALARGGENDFGREAIDTLVKFMEDHRDDIAIIAAGYPDEMAQFIAANPGLQSRFTRTIAFPDYTDDELLAIFESLGERQRYHLDDEGRAVLSAIIAAEPRTTGFGNARFVRNLFEHAVARHALRLHERSSARSDVALTDDDLTTLTADDLLDPVAPDRPGHGPGDEPGTMADPR